MKEAFFMGKTFYGEDWVFFFSGLGKWGAARAHLVTGLHSQVWERCGSDTAEGWARVTGRGRVEIFTWTLWNRIFCRVKALCSSLKCCLTPTFPWADSSNKKIDAVLQQNGEKRNVKVLEKRRMQMCALLLQGSQQLRQLSTEVQALVLARWCWAPNFNISQLVTYGGWPGAI